MDLTEILTVGFKGGASDIHLKVGLPPMFRIAGSLVSLRNADRLTPEAIRDMLYDIMSKRQQELLQNELEIDFAYGIGGVGRFRINAFHQRGSVGAAIRVIPMHVPTFDELRLPPVLKKIAEFQRGLILVTGTTSAGKSSTLAAMIDHINRVRTCHIITIEDPIEFLIRDRRSMINQREVNMDTFTFGKALKSALRQDPDVILLGELRDLETFETAMAAAETGHLVMSTLHTMDTTETINRIISLFPPHHQHSVRLQLATVLKAVISQRLVPTADGKGRAPAVEVMINTKHVRQLIEDESRVKEISEAIAAGYTSYGMQTFDQSLMSLVHSGLITYDQALTQASNPDDFALRYKGIQSSSDGRWEHFDKSDTSADSTDDDILEVERFGK